MPSAPDILRLRTAENVGIDYRLAGLGSRFLARLIDEVALLPVEIVLGIAAGTLLSALASSAEGAIMAVLLTGAILLFGRACYFILLEWAMGGQTPGKRVLAIRVVRASGGGIGFTESLIRNLVRMFEELLLSAPTVISMFVDRRSRRLGDFAAGTLVVHVRREAAGGYPMAFPAPYTAAPVYLQIRSGGDPIPGLSALGQREHSFLRSFLSRPDLHPLQRRRLAAEMATTLCERMALPVESVERQVPPEALIERIYLQLSERLGAQP
ncbi:MAG: RDD family protein [Candidatus Dormibacteria bacterium]